MGLGWMTDFLPEIVAREQVEKTQSAAFSRHLNMNVT
jgi:hypothetical protein